MLDFKTYEEQAGVTAIYPEAHKGIYPILALGGEVGEIQNKAKKIIRGDEGAEEKLRKDIEKEIGDCLWYLAAVARDYGTTLEKAALGNIVKLQDRMARNTIQGSGDDR